MMMFLHRIDRVMLRLSWLPTIVLLSALALVAVQAADRDPPFAVLSVYPAAAKPGELVVIRARVWRDPSRRCSATRARSMFDAQGVRFDYPMHQFSADFSARVERETPGLVTLSVMVPPEASPGQAHLVSVLQYACNQVHAIFPIEVTTVMPFTVLP